MAYMIQQYNRLLDIALQVTMKSWIYSTRQQSPQKLETFWQRIFRARQKLIMYQEPFL